MAVHGAGATAATVGARVTGAAATAAAATTDNLTTATTIMTVTIATTITVTIIPAATTTATGPPPARWVSRWGVLDQVCLWIVVVLRLGSERMLSVR